MLQWSAKTINKTYSSEQNDYSEIPMKELISFNVYGFGYVLHVDVTTGALQVNGHPAAMPDLIDAVRSELEWPLKLYYSQRRYLDFNPASGSPEGSGIEYVVVGWEGRFSRAFWKLEAKDVKVQMLVEAIE